MRSHRRRTDPLIHYVWRTICCIYQSVCFIPHLSAFILQKCWLKYFKMCTRMFKNVHWGIVCKNGQRERGTAYISSSRAVGWDALESYHAVLATNKKMKWFSIDSGRLLNLWLLVGPGMGLQGHMVVLFLVLWGTSILFSIVAAPFCILTNSVQRF